MVSEHDLIEEFELFGVDLSSADSIDRVKDLCASYKLDASAIVAQWVSFAHSTHIDVNPSYEMLDVFEREKLMKKDAKGVNQLLKSKTKRGAEIPSLLDVGTGEDMEEMCSTYSTPSAKINQNKRQHTPDNAPLKKLTSNERLASVPFSPASFSPAAPPSSKKYISRQNAGEVLFSHGPMADVAWRRQDRRDKPSVTIGAYDDETSLCKQYQYMFQKLTDKAHVLNDMIDDMAEELQKHHNIEAMSHVALATQDQVTVAGRVCCDSHGKLNPQSVLLQGSRKTSAGKSVSVDISHLKEFSLFPGQIVAMDGANNNGQKFIAKKIYEGCPPPKIEKRTKTDSTSVIHAVIACGPFTTSDNVCYEPLADFVKYLHTYEPDVAIMLGPFVDIKNSEIESCGLGVTFEEHFNTQIEHLSQATLKLGCELVLVPSYRDAHHDYVYPQPPYHISNPSPHVHCLSDPALININDTVVAVTSSDILFHLGAEEISCTPGLSDRLGRLVSHVINQHSFYPLYPPAADVNVDHDYFEQYATLPVMPDVLILPSDLRYFIKVPRQIAFRMIDALDGTEDDYLYNDMIASSRGTTQDPEINDCDDDDDIYDECLTEQEAHFFY